MRGETGWELSPDSRMSFCMPESLQTADGREGGRGVGRGVGTRWWKGKVGTPSKVVASGSGAGCVVGVCGVSFIAAIYAPVVTSLLKDYPILGMAHITGGGIPGNIPRCIPDGLEARVNYDSWKMPKVFSKIMLAGEVPEEEMKKVFNLGIGYCLVVPEEAATDVQLRIDGHKLQSWVIGDIIHKGKDLK